MSATTNTQIHCFTDHVMTFYDLVYYKIMQTMCRAKAKLLPDSVRRLFSIHECEYDLRDVCKFTVQKAKKGMKRRCIYIVGVQLWNNVIMDELIFDFQKDYL